MPIAKPPNHKDEWKFEGDAWHYMHIVSEYYDTDPIKDADCMKRHVLLEFLDYLGVLQYSRGYDGIYYDIMIKVQSGK